jgi:pyruvate/2-oxoglutarate dehydrogenase complex dihydrolipoamide dehydrogenase (E3) component
LAQVGLTETAAKKRGRAFQVLRWPYFDNDRAQAERQTQGHVKVIAASSGQIIGATIVGAQAGEMISAWALAVQQRLNIQAFAELILPYPTLAEIGQKAANSRFKAGLTGPLLGRIINRLRQRG